jgi:hypothetical protein
MQRREAVYRAYWSFAAERQRIFERRIDDPIGPWTDDEILGRYKFTNAWRASDRVTQYLIRDVIYERAQLPADDQIARIVLFRLFSKPSTWKAIEARLGPVTAKVVNGGALRRLLDELHAEGPIYTGAFILCADKAYGFDRKHHNHLALVQHMLHGRRLPRALARARRLQDVYDALRAFPLIGPFMAYQIAIDLNYSELIDFCEDEFTVPGPGAERGIRKVFPSATRRQMPVIIEQMVQRQYDAYDDLPVGRPTLFGLPLRAIDCQNLFCELDKYARVRFPQLRSNRSRIKATFAPAGKPLRLFYPPKWGINERLPDAHASLQQVA